MSVKSIAVFPRSLILLALAGWSIASLLHAELTEEQKRELFVETHHAHPSPTPHHSHHQTSPVHHASGTSSSHKGKKKSTHPVSHPAVTPPLDHELSPTAQPVTTHTDTPADSVSHPPVQQSMSPSTSGLSAASTIPAASESISLPHGATPSAPITIEKSGVEQAQGMEPAPVSSGLFGWLFGGGGHRTYNYLNASTRSAIDHAPVRRGRWKYIIVHNSGTREGNARVFDIYHLRVRHMVNGLAYHFVIGDGHGSGDGQIEIGHRWTAQLNGGHVASDYLNDISLGICLVGDFNRDVPTKAQIGALEELISYLRDRVGKTQGRRAIIYAHKEINPRPTDCPGDRFPYNWLHTKFR